MPSNNHSAACDFLKRRWNGQASWARKLASDEILKQADDLAKELVTIRDKISYTRDQLAIIIEELRKSHETVENAQRDLEEYKNRTH